MNAVRALVIGYSGILIGRLNLYGLATDDQKDVEKIVVRFIQEAEVSLTLSGVSDLSQVNH
nr:alpha-hydroxy-acid oxidizing protein [Gracilibacillus boraciitolerans]